VSYIKGKHHQLGVVDFGQYAIVTHSVTPCAGQIAGQTLASSTGVGQGGDLVEIVEDATCNRFVQGTHRSIEIRCGPQRPRTLVGVYVWAG